MEGPKIIKLILKYGSGWVAAGGVTYTLYTDRKISKADNLKIVKDTVKIEEKKAQTAWETLQLKKKQFEWQQNVDKRHLGLIRRRVELDENEAKKGVYNYLMNLWGNPPDDVKNDTTDTISEKDMVLKNEGNPLKNEESVGTKIVHNNMSYKNKKQLFDEVFNDGSSITPASPVLENNIDFYHILGITSLFIGICLSFYIYICVYKGDTNISKVLPKPKNLGMMFIYLICTGSTNNSIFQFLFLNFTQENLWQYVSLLYFAVVVTTIFLIILFNQYLCSYVREVLPFVEGLFILSMTLLLASLINKIIVNFFLLMLILYIFNIMVLCIMYLRIYNKNLFKYCLVIFINVLIVYNLFGMVFYFNFYDDLGFIEHSKELGKQYEILKQEYEELLNEIRKFRKNK